MADWLANLNTDSINPEPVIVEEPDVFIRDFLCPTKLQEITGEEDLESVESIEMVVNTSETTLGNFGQYLPFLSQLKLNDSFIPSVRDIGTAFSCLTVLWMSRSSVNEVDGIGSMKSLQELYISYNNISDLSPISFLDNLEVLDLEANQVSEIDQLDYLSIIGGLTTLTLSANPVCQYYNKETDQNFRQYVLSLLPNLQQLDDVSTSISDEKNELDFSLQEDIEIITKAIKAVNLENGFDSTFSNSTRPVASTSKSILPSSFLLSPLTNLNRTRPATSTNRKQSYNYEKVQSSSYATGSNRPGSSDSDSGIVISDDSSALTFGNPLCGNPIQALKQRRKDPIPAFNFLDNDFVTEPILRPSTSLGLRTVSKNTSKSYIINNNNEVSKAFKNESFAEIVEFDLPCTSKGTSSTHISDVSINDFSSISHNQSTSPFRSPTPPQSPIRPNSARNYRLLRRSFPKNSKQQTINVMTVSSVEKPCKQPDSSNSSVEDQSA